VAIVCLTALAALADRAEAEPACGDRAPGELVLDADDALSKGDAARALELSTCAEEKVSAPTIVLLEARALEKLGRVVEAKAAADRAVAWPPAADEPEPFKTARAAAAALSTALAAKVAHVAITVPPGAEALSLALDGKRIEPGKLDVDPGHHTVEASARGMKPSTSTFDVAPGETRALPLSFEPVAAATPAPTPAGKNYLPAGILWGVAGAGIVVGAVLSGVSFAKFEEVEHACPPPAPCAKSLEPTIQPKYDAALGLANGAVAAFVVTGVVAGVAIAVTILAPSKSAAPAVAARVGPGGAALVGAF
jgi:hypothetical protein